MRPTPPFSTPPPPTERVRHLAKGDTVFSVVERSREAGIAFVKGTTGGWSAHDLAVWLVEHYEPATAPTRSLVRQRKAPLAHRGPDAATLERVVLAARARLFEMLDGCASAWAGESFAREMVDGRFVVGVHDAHGAIGYAPVRYADMRLVDRVISLFVADYLTRPNDYRLLVPCEECGDLAYDGVRRHASWCEAPPRLSDVVPAIEVPSRDTEPGLSAAPTLVDEIVRARGA
jgi:hypothetical protein